MVDSVTIDSQLEPTHQQILLTIDFIKSSFEKTKVKKNRGGREP